MIPIQHWARNISITDDDVEHLLSLLLEEETPLRTMDAARALVAQRLQNDADTVQARYQDVIPYLPSGVYDVGQKIIFPTMEFAIGQVEAVRSSNNPNEPEYTVIRVLMDDAPETPREFASSYSLPHRLNDAASNGSISLPGSSALTVEDIMREYGTAIIAALEANLAAQPELVSVAGRWFPQSLVIEVNAGHLNLAEAVLDINNGGPMLTQSLLNEIGGLGDYPIELQVFSMNYALNQDARFDEVGPVDTVLWYLKRVEPQEVLNTPNFLQYTPVDYDDALLTAEQIRLETEIDDEWSDLPESDGVPDAVQITLNYPHRRAGTLPLNARMREVFPTARRTPRVWVTLVDGQDGEEFPGWVVRGARYVYGLSRMYRKHKLPVGAIILIKRSPEPGKIIVDFRAHNPRIEYLRLIVPKEGQITFEEQKRSIGADYDDLMILGADDIAAVDALHQTSGGGGSRRTLAGTLKVLVSELGRSSPQGAVHAKTLYSALNVMRRCPPGPIFATLVGNADFESVGNHYWRLSEA